MSGKFESTRQNFVLHENLRRKYHSIFIAKGFRRCRDRKLFPYMIAANIMALLVLVSIQGNGVVAGMIKFLWRVAGALVLVIADLVVLYVLGAPKEYIQIMRRIERVPDFRNDDGEAAILLDRKIVNAKYNVEEWEFQSFGIGFDEWQKNQQQIENALDISILSINYGADNTKVVLRLLIHPGPWPDVLRWNDRYLPEKESQLCLGMNRSYPITLDLAQHPHYMIAAETGAGKTVLLTGLILQSIKKNFSVILIDMKKFVDYFDLLPFMDKIIDNKAELGEVLTGLVEEMNSRMELFGKVGARNIDDYNRKMQAGLKRIVVVIDEYTEALDKGGSKEEKTASELIEKNIARLCRLSRAAGIHLLIGLQRGSAQEIDGQIRNNTRKILGRCDENLCITMTGNSELCKLLPNDSVGMFVTDKRELFKAFYPQIDPRPPGANHQN